MIKSPIPILMAEDDDGHAVLIQDVFNEERGAARVFRVNDGQEAMDYLYHRGHYSLAVKAPRPRLILLDIAMPKLDCLEVLRRVKADTQLRAIPIVMLTSSDRQKEIDKSYRLGASSYVTKPTDYDSLCVKLRKLRSFLGILEFPQNGGESP